MTVGGRGDGLNGPSVILDHFDNIILLSEPTFTILQSIVELLK
jgi:hypothetical protein